MPPQPQGASLHGWISAVWFGSVGGDEFDFGWGADPQTPEIVYFCVFSTTYTIYLTLFRSDTNPGQKRAFSQRYRVSSGLQ